MIAIWVWLLVILPCRPSSSIIPTGLPLAAPLAHPVPFLFPVAVLILFPCDRSCPLWTPGVLNSSVDIDTSNEELFLQHTVFTSTEGHILEIQRLDDRIKVFIRLHCYVFWLMLVILLINVVSNECGNH